MVAPRQSKEDVVVYLARSHREADPSLRAIYRLISAHEEDPEEPIKLLEVNPDTPATGVDPIRFNAHPPSGLHYPAVIVEVTPEEFGEIKNGRVRLPDHWQLDAEVQLDG